MALTSMNDAINLLHTGMRAIKQDFLGLRIAELGNQRVKGWGKQLTSRAVFAVCGAERHLAIDLNGRDHVLKHDLGTTLPSLQWLKNEFDVVTNFGTSEHVNSTKDAQFQCFQTIHALCRPGGVMIHYVPAAGHRPWPKHGFFTYSEEFFQELAVNNIYRPVIIEPRPKWNRKSRSDDWYMCAVLVKLADNVFSRSFPLVTKD